ncbi:MAG TPA: hypothetical protein VJ995_09585 [Geothermobacteraceae bacterium]|nr:hypothetical protein [Geothermobacteraceae bacterium]
MKSFVIVLLAGMLSLGLSSFALAGMNHQPHSVKTFMGKERKARTAISLNDQQKGATQKDGNHIKPYRKGPRRVNN